VSFPDLPVAVTERTVPQLLQAAAVEAGNHVALIGHSLIAGGEDHVTYAELAQRARRLAAVLHARGVGKGDRVAMLFANDGGIDAHVCYHAVHHLGAINVPVNTRFVDRELRHVLGFADPAAIVFAGEFAPIIGRVIDPAHPPALIEAAGSPELGESLGSLLASADDGHPPTTVDETDDADWVFTSGTTGSPKAVVLSHSSAVACGHQAQQLWGLGSDSIYQCFAPFFTSTGCHTALLPALVSRCTYVVEPTPWARDSLARLVRYRTTTYFALTNLLALLYRKAEPELVEALDAGYLRRLCYGGQVMPRAFHEKVHRMFSTERGIEVVSLYGLSEGGPCGLMVDPEDHQEAVRRTATWGLPIGRRGFNSWVEFRVASDTGETLPAAEIGELLMRAPSVMSRYAFDETASAETLRDGWLHTGDLVLRDEDGYVFFVGRLKHMIRRNGLNISGTEVEAVLLGHPAVLEAIVVPRPSSAVGEDVHAVIVLTASDVASEKEILAHCRAELADYKVPRSLAFVDSLPRNANGRVVRTELPSSALPWLNEDTIEETTP